MGLTLQNECAFGNKEVEKGLGKREKQKDNYGLGRNFREEDSGEDETTFSLRPPPPPHLTVWRFPLSPLASSFPCPLDGTALQNLVLSSLSRISLCPSNPCLHPLTHFHQLPSSDPIPLCRGVHGECHHHSHGWCSRSACGH